MDKFPELYFYLLGATGDLWVRYPDDLPLSGGFPDSNEGQEKIIKSGFYNKNLQTPTLCACYKQ